MLNQTPSAGHGLCSGVKELHCLIHNHALHWIDERCGPDDSPRWMSADEHLMSMAFPIQEQLQPKFKGQPIRISSFDRPDPFAPKKRTFKVGAAGNSMNVCVTTVVLLYVLGFIEWKDASPDKKLEMENVGEAVVKADDS
eukprot:8025399-Karenia_brevis.AAC.1